MYEQLDGPFCFLCGRGDEPLNLIEAKWPKPQWVCNECKETLSKPFDHTTANTG